MRLFFFHDMLQILLDRHREVSENVPHESQTTPIERCPRVASPLPLHAFLYWMRNIETQIDILLCMYTRNCAKIHCCLGGYSDAGLYALQLHADRPSKRRAASKRYARDPLSHF